MWLPGFLYNMIPRTCHQRLCNIGEKQRYHDCVFTLTQSIHPLHFSFSNVILQSEQFIGEEKPLDVLEELVGIINGISRVRGEHEVVSARARYMLTEKTRVIPHRLHRN